MDYAAAKNIRNKSFGTLLAEQEGGLGSSMKAAVSQKTQAKMAGLQETFDPMNIAKFLTFDSNWAPAMLGKLTGRKKSSIDYFSGVKQNKVGKVGDEGVEGGGVGDVLGILQKIEALLHTTREEDKLKAEKEKAGEEGRNLRKAKRHRALMEAITGKFYTQRGGKNSIVDGTSATKDDGNEPGSAGGGSAWSSLFDVLTGIATPTNAVYAALLAPWLLNAYQRSETEKDPNNPEWKDTPYARVVRGEAVTQGQAAAQNQRTVIKQVSPQYAKELLAATPKFTDAELVQETGKNRKELQDWMSTNPKTNLKLESPQSTPPENTVSGDEKLNSPTTTTETSKSSSTTTETPKSPSTTGVLPSNSTASQTTKSPMAAPVTETPKTGQALDSVQKTNLELNLPKGQSNPVNVINNNSSLANGAGFNTSLIIPAVRNMEETFQRMIFNSTRVV